MQGAKPHPTSPPRKRNQEPSKEEHKKKIRRRRPVTTTMTKVDPHSPDKGPQTPDTSRTRPLRWGRGFWNLLRWIIKFLTPTGRHSSSSFIIVGTNGRYRVGQRRRRPLVFSGSLGWQSLVNHSSSCACSRPLGVFSVLSLLLCHRHRLLHPSLCLCPAYPRSALRALLVLLRALCTRWVRATTTNKVVVSLVVMGMACCASRARL